MHTIKFQDGKFEVSLTGNGTFHVEMKGDYPLSDLTAFQRSFNEHMFSKALMADTIHPDTGADKSLPADELVEFADDRSIQLNDGKYEIGRTVDHHIIALRYGDPWRDCLGDNLMAALFDYACDLEDVLKDQRENIRKIDVLLNGDGAAEQASACDIVSQLEAEVAKGNGLPLLQRLQFNGLSAAEAERLFLLMEERAESIQAAAKVLRHGYESRHPFIEGSSTNRQALEKEEGDGCAAMDLLCKAGDLSVGSITKAAIGKGENVRQWLHHQPENSNEA